MKKFLLALCLLTAMSAYCEQLLVFRMGSERVASIPLEDQPAITVADDNGVTKVSVQSKNYAGTWDAATMKIALEKTESVDGLKAEGGIVVRYLADNILEVTSPAEAPLQLFNTNGAPYGVWTLAAGTPLQIDLNRYPTGVYLLRSGKFAIKVIRK